MGVLASKDPKLLAEDEDLKLFGAVVSPPPDHEATQSTRQQGEEEEHRGIVDDPTAFSTPTREVFANRRYEDIRGPFELDGYRHPWLRLG